MLPVGASQGAAVLTVPDLRALIPLPTENLSYSLVSQQLHLVPLSRASNGASCLWKGHSDTSPVTRGVSSLGSGPGWRDVSALATLAAGSQFGRALKEALL